MDLEHKRRRLEQRRRRFWDELVPLSLSASVAHSSLAGEDAEEEQCGRFDELISLAALSLSRAAPLYSRGAEQRPMTPREVEERLFRPLWRGEGERPAPGLAKDEQRERVQGGGARKKKAAGCAARQPGRRSVIDSAAWPELVWQGASAGVAQNPPRSSLRLCRHTTALAGAACAPHA